MRNFITISIFLYSILFVSISLSQNRAIITAVKGGNVEFIFNSLNAYQNGISYTDYTQFSVVFEYAADPTVEWEIKCGANTATISSDGTAPDLNLNAIQITASDANGNLATATFTGQQTLVGPAPGTTVQLVRDGPQGAEAANYRVNISYACGVASPLLGKEADRYTTIIWFILEEE